MRPYGLILSCFLTLIVLSACPRPSQDAAQEHSVAQMSSEAPIPLSQETPKDKAIPAKPVEAPQTPQAAQPQAQIPVKSPQKTVETSRTQNRVFLVVLENTDYKNVIGSKHMPFVNKLASDYGLATNYFGNTHPSIGNYFALTTGRVITNDSHFSGTFPGNNLVRQLENSDRSWKVFAESLPSIGFLGGDIDSAYPYVRRHNPFSYFSDVVASFKLRGNLVPYNDHDFQELLASNALPDFVFIVPNQNNNMHDCPDYPKSNNCTLVDKLEHVDRWLEHNLSPILANPDFQKRGLLILTFDEATESKPEIGQVGDNRHGGGQVATIVISPRVKKGYKSSTFFQHPSVLRLICDELNLTNCPGASVKAAKMNEFFRQ